ncbi:MAG: hypothetical protein Q8934_09065 [Bacillota bacterium]|nr:hypothetical protein [Bacillota bacterium]
MAESKVNKNQKKILKTFLCSMKSENVSEIEIVKLSKKGEITMKLPFNTHTIYVTFDNDKIYELKSDYTKIGVQKIECSSKENPVMVLHKNQFDYAKDYLLNKENPFKIDEETARIYNQIGFLTNEELNNYIIS